jgi:hypothetical protein
VRSDSRWPSIKLGAAPSFQRVHQGALTIEASLPQALHAFGSVW